MANNEERKPLLVGGGGEPPTPTAPVEGDQPPPYMEVPTVPQPCKDVFVMCVTKKWSM